MNNETPSQIWERLSYPLRYRAAELGYALTVHGSLARDIDLVAIPWQTYAADPKVLCEALREGVEQNNAWGCFVKVDDNEEWCRNGRPGMKPHGRLVWQLYVSPCIYIDLSVMPRGDLIGPLRELIADVDREPNCVYGFPSLEPARQSLMVATGAGAIPRHDPYAVFKKERP